jgi:hypothetical protein
MKERMIDGAEMLGDAALMGEAAAAGRTCTFVVAMATMDSIFHTRSSCGR